jgi:serine/threonine protein kinase
LNASLCYSCMKKVALADASACPYCREPLPYKTRGNLDLEPGTLLQDRYVIGRLLGRGGFGATYIAFDNASQERCAVKEYFPNQMVTRSPDSADVTLLKPREFEFYKQRFFAEANQLRNLSHVEGLVRLYDVFTANQTAYFVMEYLPGTNLKAYLRQHQDGLPHRNAIDILTQLLNILSSVHSSGVLHRDISLDNILLMDDGRVKLIDFGSARNAVQSGMTTFVKGVYTAPEQAQGMTQDKYTDLYAVGVVMFELFMGRTPKVQDGNLEPMCSDEKSPLYQVNRVYMKATRTQPAQRYQLAQDMLSAVQAIEPIDNKTLRKTRQKKQKGGSWRRAKAPKKKARADVNTYKGRAKRRHVNTGISRVRKKKERSTASNKLLAAILVLLSVLFLALFILIVLS